MLYEDAFLQEILENREDDTPRRIYADWLMDHADAVCVARGEFIHVQCDLARTPPGPARAPLVRREQQLLEAYAGDWGRPFCELGCTCWEYRRGMVEGVGIPAKAMLSQAATLLQLSPISHLKLYAATGLCGEVAHCRHLSRLRTLDLEKNDLDDSDLKSLSRSPNLKSIDTLLLWSNGIGDRGLGALLEADLPNLLRLDLSNNVVADTGAAALASATFLSRLKLLDLTNNQITDTGAQALLDSPFSVGLNWMDLSKNPISLSVQTALREWHAKKVASM